MAPFFILQPFCIKQLRNGYDLKRDFLTLAGAGRCGDCQRLQRLVNGLIIVACHADGGDEGKDQIDVAVLGFVVGADAARHSVDEVGQGNRHGFAVRHAFGVVAFVFPALRQAKVAVGVVLHGGEIGVFGGGVIAGRNGAVPADDAAVSAIPGKFSGRPQERSRKAVAIRADEPSAAEPAASDGAAV